MDTDAGRVQDELRRSRSRDNGRALTGSEETWQQSPMLPGVSPLAGALAEGRGNGPVRAQAMRNAQSTYGNTSVQRYLRGRSLTSNPIPVQRVLIPGEVSDELKKLGIVSAYAADPEPDTPTIAPPAAPLAAPNIAPAAVPTIAPLSAPSIAPSIAPSAAPNIVAGETPGYKTRSLLEDYQDEDWTAAHGYTTADDVSITTKYLTEQAREPYEVSVGERGRLFQGGQLLDTDAGGARTGLRAKGSAGGHLYAMSPQGQIYSADMASEWEKGGMQGPDATVKKVKGTYQPTDPSAESAKATTFHHSSFLAGGAVAGAGEMKVHEGILSMISNASGHYLPGPENVMQTLHQLEAGGAAVDQARVHLMGDLTGAGYDASKEVTAAVGEFKQAGGSRDELLKRHRVLGELNREFGVGVADSGPLKGIQMEPPDNGDIEAAQKDVFASLARKNPFAKAFRDTKRAEGEVEHPAHYGDFMKRATGRDIRPKPKKPFSFAPPVEAPAALPPASSIAPSRQSYQPYGAHSDSGPALTSAPSIAPTLSSPQLTATPAAPRLAYTAYSAQSRSEPDMAYQSEVQESEAPVLSIAIDSADSTDTVEDANALPEGYVSQEAVEAQAQL